MNLIIGLDIKCISLDVLPINIKGFVKKSGDIYYIYVNDKLSEEEQAKTIEHELEHIKSGDIDCPSRTLLIEMYTSYLEGGLR